MNPQYQESLRRSLRTFDFTYVYLGHELGARPDYEQVAKTPLFQSGLDRVQEGMRRFRLVLICAEKEPGEGRLESHGWVMARVREKLGCRRVICCGRLLR
jgi:hypothetical protein